MVAVSSPEITAPVAVGLRRLLWGRGISALGDGLWFTVWALYFTRVLHLAPTTVGVGMAVAGGAGLAAAVPLGALADRFSPRAILIVVTAVRGAAMAAYLLVHGAWGVLLVTVVFVALANGGTAVRTALVAALVRDNEARLAALGRQRVIQHVGYAIGAGLGAVVQSVDRPGAYVLAIAGNAATFAVLAAMTAAVPKPTARPPLDSRPSAWIALADRPYVKVMVVSAVLSLCWAMLSTGLPLWISYSTRLPLSLSGAVVVISSVGIALLQLPANRLARTTVSAARTGSWAGVALAVGCVLLAATSGGGGLLASAAVIAAALFHLAGELGYVASNWGLSVSLMREEAKGAYQGVSEAATATVQIVAPAIFTSALGTFGAGGWLLVAAVFLAVAVPLPPARPPRPAYPLRASAQARARTPRRAVTTIALAGAASKQPCSCNRVTNRDRSVAWLPGGPRHPGFVVGTCCNHLVPRRVDPEAPRTVLRTARVGLRVTSAQRRRCFGLLVAAGDVWACVLDVNRWRRQRGLAPIVGYQALCRELSAAGPGTFGELGTIGARSVLRRYSDAWFAAAKRRAAGDASARFPRRKRRLMPVRYYHGTFTINDKHLRLPISGGRPPLWVRLDRELPYPVEQVRSVTLLNEGARLFVEVTAEIPVATYSPGSEPDPDRVAGVDPGVIHPYAVAGPDGEGLLISGRAIRAEAHLHLKDAKDRRRAVAKRAPKPGQVGSRRWRKYRARQRKIEARHKRRIKQAQHEAAKQVVEWAMEQRIGTLRIGDPRGVLELKAGRRHNQRLRDWRPGYLIRCLKDKATQAGIRVELVDERGSSSTCPVCGRRVPKPAGRRFSCMHCGFIGHRDLVGGANIAHRTPVGGSITTKNRFPVVITHRRAGRHLPGAGPSRRDPRRRPHHGTAQGAPGRPRPAPPPGGESLAPTGEDQPTRSIHDQRCLTRH